MEIGLQLGHHTGGLRLIITPTPPDHQTWTQKQKSRVYETTHMPTSGQCKIKNSKAGALRKLKTVRLEHAQNKPSRCQKS
jgi:hypothetical protein